jgi:hypothetical protein
MGAGGSAARTKSATTAPNHGIGHRGALIVASLYPVRPPVKIGTMVEDLHWSISNDTSVSRRRSAAGVANALLGGFGWPANFLRGNV